MEVRQIPPQDPAHIIACILDIGELLLTSGAEVMRVEDTVGRLCAAEADCRKAAGRGGAADAFAGGLSAGGRLARLF